MVLILAMILFALSISPSYAVSYLANAKSGKFHIYNCPTIKHPNAAHFVPYNSRDAAIADGYIPCKRCDP
ncbi:MAG: nuclease [Selenomonadaceae bacterium]|nr:nuclease [Selenomonadaceae bacterium]